MSHNAERELHQKLLIVDSFPGRHSISDNSGITNTRKQIKCFFRHTLDEQLFGIYRQGQF